MLLPHIRRRDMMKLRTTATALMLLLGTSLCVAQDAFMGTWKLTERKSEFSPGAPKNSTVVYEAEGDKIRVTVDSVDNEGKATHYTWMGKFDGTNYPVTGDPNSDSRSYTPIDDHILGFNVMKGRKVITSGRIVVSADGKSRTVTMSGIDANGHKFSSSEVYEKQ